MAGSDRVAVFGTGYLGAARAACLAELGHDVLGVDPNPAQVQALSAGWLPFWEPGLEELMQRGLASGRLRFTTSYPQAARFADVHVVCVGTPQRPGCLPKDIRAFQARAAELGAGGGRRDA